MFRLNRAGIEGIEKFRTPFLTNKALFHKSWKLMSGKYGFFWLILPK